MKDVMQQQPDQTKAKLIPCSRKMLAVSIALLAASAPAFSAAENAKGAFDEVVVTAQRRTELAVDVPIAITSIDAEQLGQGDVQRLSDIGKLTPSLRFDNTGGFAQPTIRGVGTAVVVAGGGSNVAVYTDGFYSPNPLMANGELLNIKSIQVLKGPQGTLFGRNSTGGAILVTTSDPSTQESIDAEISYGSYNAQTYKVYATGGADMVAFDIAGSLRKGDGFIDNIATGSDHDGEYENSAIRIGGKLELSDRFSALLRYTHTDTDDAYPVNVSAYEKDGTIYSTAAFLAANNIPGFTNTIVATKPYEVSNGYRPLFTSKDDTVQLTIKADLDFALFTSYTQYRDEIGTHHHDFDGSSAEMFHYKYDTTDEIFTQEFLLSSLGEGKLQWTTGLFYFNDETAFEKNSASQNGSAFFRTGGSGVTTNSIAAFGDVTYALLDNLYLTAGLRYSKDKITDAFFLDQLTGTQKTDVPDVDDDQLTPRIALRYEINPSSSVYASYTEGFKSGILNVGGGTLDDVEVKPEEIKAYEIGYKYSAGDLMFDVASYYYDYKNLQVASYVGASSVIHNAANSTVYGFDGQIRYAVTEKFEINLGAAYLHAEYDDFEESQVWTQSAFGTYTPEYADAGGNQMQHSPKFTGTLGASYTTDVGFGSLNISGTLYHTSDFYFDSSETYKEDAYDLLSMRIAWTDPSSHYTVAVFGDNLTDEEYHTQVLPQQLGTWTTWGAPRTVGVSLGMHF